MNTITVRQIGSERVAFVGPDIPDAAPAAVREGIARRNIVSAGGTCPCGAELVMPNRAQRRAAQRRGEPLHVQVEHEDTCPALDENIRSAWRAGR